MADNSAAEKDKKSGGAGKFFLGAAIGAIAGAIAGKVISDRAGAECYDEEDEECEKLDDKKSCKCSKDCKCKKDEHPRGAEKDEKTETTKKVEKTEK